MKQTLRIICSVLIFAACNTNDNKPVPQDNEVTNCFLGYDYDYEKLLTKEDIQKVISIDETSFKKKISSNKDNYGYCQYKWKSDRPDLQMELLGQNITGPDYNIVEIKRLDFLDQKDLELYNHKSFIDLFNVGYEKLTEAKFKELKNNLEKEYAKDKDALENALKLLEIRKNLTYEKFNNLGDSAYWKWDDTYGVELVVLTGQVKFTILGKTTNNRQEGLATAVKLAELVLQKCKS